MENILLMKNSCWLCTAASIGGGCLPCQIRWDVFTAWDAVQEDPWSWETTTVVIFQIYVHWNLSFLSWVLFSEPLLAVLFHFQQHCIWLTAPWAKENSRQFFKRRFWFFSHLYALDFKHVRIFWETNKTVLRKQFSPCLSVSRAGSEKGHSFTCECRHQKVCIRSDLLSLAPFMVSSSHNVYFQLYIVEFTNISLVLLFPLSHCSSLYFGVKQNDAVGIQPCWVT